MLRTFQPEILKKFKNILGSEKFYWSLKTEKSVAKTNLRDQ